MSAYDREKTKVLKDNAVDKKMSNMKESNMPHRNRHKRPDKQLYVPRALRKTCTENSVEKEDTGPINKAADNIFKEQYDSSSLPKDNPNNVKDIKSSNSDINDIIKQSDESSIQTAEDSLQEKIVEYVPEENSKLALNIYKHCIKDTNQSHDILKIDIAVKESIKLDENIFHLSEDKMNSETIDESTNNVKNAALCNSNETLNNPLKVVEDNTSSENPEDSWENMFNDDGDCLDPKLIKELCDITGEIDLAVAKSDYSNYQAVSMNSAEEFDNVVELYGFPVEFKTHDLTSAFSSFQEATYNIKWVDDTHALAIFCSPAIAVQALTLSHPFIKVRPVSEGIKESKEKARFCAKMLVRKPRPLTSAVLARRLVSGALGLKVNASKEQRDLERNLLKEAKEKKKLKAQQRQDIWNGIV